MTLLNTAAEHLRESIGMFRNLEPSHRNPERFHETKSEIKARLHQIADLLEGNVNLTTDGPQEAPAPRRRTRRTPHQITSSRGNVVLVDFVNRRAIRSDNTPK